MGEGMRSRVDVARDARLPFLAGALLLLGAALLAACGSTGGEPDPAPPTFVLSPPGTVNSRGSLAMTASTAGVYPGREDELQVLARLLDPAGNPVAGERVIFQAGFEGAIFQPAPPAGTLLAQDQFPAGFGITDLEGVAVVNLRAPVAPGRMPVTATVAELRLSALIFIDVFDNGFIPGEPGEGPTVVPASVELTQPTPGFELNFVVVGGVPFDAPDEPYILTTAESGIGTAEIVFDGTFPAFIRYTLTGTGSGTHTFAVVDEEGNAFTTTVKAEREPIVITPPSTTLPSLGQEDFNISGGLAPYTCSTGRGQVNPSRIEREGGWATYTAPLVRETAQINLVCTDAAAQNALATITVTPPAPTPVPSATPAPTPTAAPPQVVPAAQTLVVGESRNFAISGGVAPFTVTANGGTVTPSTVAESGGSFLYTATTAGTFTSLVSASNGAVASFSTTNLAPTPTPAP